MALTSIVRMAALSVPLIADMIASATHPKANGTPEDASPLHSGIYHGHN